MQKQHRETTECAKTAPGNPESVAILAQAISADGVTHREWSFSIAQTLGPSAAAMACLLASVFATAFASVCTETLNNLIKYNVSDVVEMLLAATGKTPPFDAGKYEVCRNIETQTGCLLKADFFNWGILPTPGGVGVSMPAACTNADMELALLALGANVPELLYVRVSKYYQGTEWPVLEGENREPNGESTSAAVAVIAVLVLWVSFPALLTFRRATSFFSSKVVPLDGEALVVPIPCPPLVDDDVFGPCRHARLTRKGTNGYYERIACKDCGYLVLSEWFEK